MKLVLTGGGTGGHITPNIALIEDLKDVEILYIGSVGGLEKSLLKSFVDSKKISFAEITTGKFRRYFSLKNFADFFKPFAGFFMARKLLKEFGAEVVFSKGGYVSLPVVLGAYSLNIPIVAHESDITPGLGNKISFKLAKKICLSFGETIELLSEEERKKAVVTGSPVRASVANGEAKIAKKIANFKDEKPVLFVMGGSQGAMEINTLIQENLKGLLKKFNIAHQVGKGNLNEKIVADGYYQAEYINEEIAHFYALADAFITRGGANSLFELGQFLKPVLVIPLRGATRGEQEKNALSFAKEYGFEILEKDYNSRIFLEKINELMTNFKGKKRVIPANKKIIEIILTAKDDRRS